MESYFKEPLFAYVVISLLVYLIGIAAAIKSKIQYGYSIFWLIPSLLMLSVCPPLIFAIYSHREKAVAKTENLQKHKDKTRFFSTMALLFYVFGTILTLLFNYVFKMDWNGGLLAYVAAYIMWLLCVSTYIILNKKNKRELNIEERVQLAY